ncbi:MAG: CRISPR-associated helicase Cas3' [Isosphaeraceae bacterium]
MSSVLYAHTREGRPREDWHVLLDHLEATARLAAKFAAAFGAEGWGHLEGLWHDVGKSGAAFQDYLAACSEAGDGVHESEVRGRVDHSTAGTQHAVKCGPPGRLLAYCIAGHHAGLPDNEGEQSSLRQRLEKLIEPLGSLPAELLDKPLPPTRKLKLPPGASSRQCGFTLAFFTRMLFSCLVDADFLDTEAFMSPERAEQRQAPRATCKELLDRLDRHLAEKQKNADDTPVNRQRRDVLAACREKARLDPGFFSLHVPTGGGKTLSSLAFGLTHAVHHDKRRVIYAIPFTSIIEQTADVFREALDDLREELLEHHSNLEPDDPARQTERTRLAAENFDATLIVTTNVQLFESLFANRTSRCRKLHRLANSVIILDEAQTLPVNLLAPTLAVLQELVNNYGATVVLCSATQPAVEKRDDFRIGLDGVRPIIDEPVRLHHALRRTTVERLGPTANEELAARLRSEHQVLCVVNSKRHAADLFNALDDPNALHLSASMCAAHRAKVVAKIRKRLCSGDPCRVISTQVIEAGVDVDFPTVFRAEAGLDSIAQAAGRCNREGRLTDDAGNPQLGRVVVFDYDSKTYRTVPLISRAADHFREVAPDHLADLLAPGAIEAFFRLHYWQKGGENGSGWDRGAEGQSILDCFEADRKTFLHAQFRTAAEAYQLIDDAQTPVLVPYGSRGEDLIAELTSMPDPPDPQWLRSFDRNAQRYVVGVWDRGLRTLLENGVLLDLHGRYCLGNSKSYDKRTGLSFDEVGLGPDNLII